MRIRYVAEHELMILTAAILVGSLPTPVGGVPMPVASGGTEAVAGPGMIRLLVRKKLQQKFADTLG